MHYPLFLGVVITQSGVHKWECTVKWYENTKVSIQGIVTTLHLSAVSGFYGNGQS